MSTRTVSDLTRSMIMAAWGVATLVLMFAVLLLGYELYNRGEDAARQLPLAAGIPSPAQSTGETEGADSAIQLYFGSPYSTGLRSETRLVRLTGDTIANCKRAFEALAAGPRTEAVPVLSSSARVRAMYLLGQGDLVVDLARDVDAPGMQSASAELLAVRALTTTLTQPALRAGNAPPIKRVQFLFEGAPTGSHFPEHIMLDFPVEPESAWIVPRRAKDGDV